MRLTLRTLLAYLDDILDPADKEELAKKVETSDFANELIHKTRDTTRRLRLSAPQVIGTGMGLDPNTVAEYLDNVLPPDSVGDFERICLESDMHLAEVASCHHVLTMVLGEPADVDPASRHRMYAIPGEVGGPKQVRIEAAHVPQVTTEVVMAATPAAGFAATPAVGLAATPMPTINQKSLVNQSVLMEVPDYLRASGWARYRGAIVGLAALLIVGAVVLFVPAVHDALLGVQPSTNLVSGASKDLKSPPMQPISPPVTSQAQAVPIPPIEPPTTEKLAPTTVRQSAPDVVPPPANSSTSGDFSLPIMSNPVSPVMPQAQVADVAATSTNTTITTQATATPATTMPADASTSVAMGAQSVTPAAGNGGNEMPQNGMDAMMPNSAVATMPATPATPTTPAVPETNNTPSGMDAGTAMALIPGMKKRPTGIPPLENNNVAIMPDATSMNQVPTQPAAVPSVNIGAFQGGKTVLLRHVDQAHAWFRVEPRAAIAIGDRLLALPEFRPRIAFNSGVSMDLSGGTLVTVKTADLVTAPELPPGDPRAAAVEIVYGRIVLVNTSMEEQRLRLTTGTTTTDLRLARNATLGVQVTRAFVPGTDPRKVPAPVLAEYQAPAGGVIITDTSGERPIIDATRWTIIDGAVSPPTPLLKPADWIDREPAPRSSVQLAVPAIELALTVDRPVDEQLLAAYDEGKRVEVKSLAARSGMHVGMFVPFVRALRDSDQKTNWRSHIDTLRVAMALNPESADKVWQTLVQERGLRVATDLYEMLCGFNPDQVGRTPEQRKNPAGPLARLINWLGSDNLDYRVLAVENLWEITGKRLIQNPAGSPTERTAGIRDWTRRLAADELIPPAAATQ